MRRIFSAFLLALVAGSVFAQVSTPGEDDLKFTAAIFANQMEKLTAGDFTDQSAKFPNTPSGLVFRELYGILRTTCTVTFKTDDRLAAHHYDEISENEWYSSPTAALREIKAMIPIVLETQKAVRRQNDMMFQFSALREGEPSAIKEFRQGMRASLEMANASKYSSKVYWQLRLIYLTQLEDIYRLLEKHRGRYKVEDGIATFTGKGAADLDHELIELEEQAFQTWSRISQIMAKNPGSGAIGKLRDAIGSVSG